MRVAGITFVQGRNDYPDADGRKYAIAIHATANNAPARNEAAYAQRRTDGVSAHFYVDGAEVIQSLDTAVRAGHAGSRIGNDNAVAVEITGQNAWTRQQWIDRVAWAPLGRVLAAVCAAYGIPVQRVSVQAMKDNPKVKGFYGHNDMRLAWGGTDHTDPGPNFPWDRLLSAVGGTPSAAEDDDMQLSDKNPFGTAPRPFTEADKDAPLWLGDGPHGNLGAMLQYMREDAYYARRFARETRTELRELAERLDNATAPATGGPVGALSDADVERIAKRVDELFAARLRD